MKMNRYEMKMPRVAFAVAAIAMMAITLALAVVVPVKRESGSEALRALAPSKLITPTSG